MAGIGFELRRILAQDSYTSLVKGYLYSTVISSGPWLMSVLSLGILGVLTISFLGFEERQAFASTVVYLYAVSLVVTGLLQMLVTRYLSDRLYQGEREALCEAFFPVLLCTLALVVPVGIVGLWGATLTPVYKVCAVAALVLVSLIWIVMIFLSASRDYRSIVLAFGLGAAVSVGAGLFWGKTHGLLGYLNGFALGQFCILALLVLKLLREFGMPRRWDWGFLQYVRRYPTLVGIGLAYNLSIWIDKFLFGLSPYGTITAGRFPTYNHYDSSTFLAFAATAPALAQFLARMETDFADTYKRYYDDIFFRRPLSRILQSKREMVDVLVRSFLDVLKLQGLVTFLLVYFADDVLRMLSLPYSQTAIFRYALIGATLQVLMLFVHIILLYFDLRGTVFALTMVFLVCNIAATQASIHLGFAYYGSGFCLAAWVGLLASVVALILRVRDLEFITFARRKIVGQTRAGRRDRARPGGQYGRYVPLPSRERT